MKTVCVKIDAEAKKRAEKMIDKKEFTRENLSRVVSNAVRNEYLRWKAERMLKRANETN